MPSRKIIRRTPLPKCQPCPRVEREPASLIDDHGSLVLDTPEDVAALPTLKPEHLARVKEVVYDIRFDHEKKPETDGVYRLFRTLASWEAKPDQIDLVLGLATKPPKNCPKCTGEGYSGFVCEDDSKGASEDDSKGAPEDDSKGASEDDSESDSKDYIEGANLDSSTLPVISCIHSLTLVQYDTPLRMRTVLLLSQKLPFLTRVIKKQDREGEEKFLSEWKVKVFSLDKKRVAKCLLNEYLGEHYVYISPELQDGQLAPGKDPKSLPEFLPFLQECSGYLEKLCFFGSVDETVFCTQNYRTGSVPIWPRLRSFEATVDACPPTGKKYIKPFPVAEEGETQEPKINDETMNALVQNWALSMARAPCLLGADLALRMPDREPADFWEWRYRADRVSKREPLRLLVRLGTDWFPSPGVMATVYSIGKKEHQHALMVVKPDIPSPTDDS